MYDLVHPIVFLNVRQKNKVACLNNRQGEQNFNWMILLYFFISGGVYVLFDLCFEYPALLPVRLFHYSSYFLLRMGDVKFHER